MFLFMFAVPLIQMMSVGTLKHMKNVGKKFKSMFKDRRRLGSSATVPESPTTPEMKSSPSRDTLNAEENDQSDDSGSEIGYDVVRPVMFE